MGDVFYVVAQAEQPMLQPDPTSQTEATQTLMVSEWVQDPRHSKGLELIWND